jgi:endonuclease-3
VAAQNLLANTNMRTESLPRKKGFDIDDMMRRLRYVTRNCEPAAVFALAQEGFGSVFQVLVACIVLGSVHETVGLRAARRLFHKASTPAQVAKLSVQQIDNLIADCHLHETKAQSIHAIARMCVGAFEGELPPHPDLIRALQGAGPRCTNLALGVGAGSPIGIPVDAHVHRVTNRWGYVRTETYDHTMLQLEKKLPRKYWLEIHKLLVPFGRAVCKVEVPRCRICPLREYCRQVGVTRFA